jgi:hypothetical protein
VAEPVAGSETVKVEGVDPGGRWAVCHTLGPSTPGGGSRFVARDGKVLDHLIRFINRVRPVIFAQGEEEWPSWVQEEA